MRENTIGIERARGANSDSNQKINNAGGTVKRFDVFNFRRNTYQRQCKRCGSDDLRFVSSDGHCLDCQQYVEFIVREHPDTAARAMNSFRNGGAI